MQTESDGVPVRNRKVKAVVAALLLAGAIGAGPMVSSVPAWARPAPESFADLIDRVGPSVVLITAKEPRPEKEMAEGPMPQLPEQFREGPLRDFFERFFEHGMPGAPMPGPRGNQAALGSGFIISSDGIVVTNNHVVGESEKIEITLKDGSHFPARLLGKDDKTDLAVLKIDADRPLPSVGWGDSDKMRVGDWVVAVGNPFGLAGTVTAGIVSSRGRDLGSGPYDDFIQIDAPLNTGNSGGPLFNSDGQVVGVNTAIFSPNGGSIGIGFAIPSNSAEKIVAELREKGSVQRGWLGVAIQPVTPEVADSLGLSKPDGALVATVTEGSPAAKAGVRQGDVVLGFNGTPVTTPRDLSRAVADSAIHSKATLAVWRDNREVNLDVRVGEMPRQVASAGEPPAKPAKPHRGGVELSALGLTLAPIDNGTRARYGLPKGASGAVVASVDERADAAEKGLKPGDVITRVNQEAVAGPSDVASAVEKAKAAQRKSILLLVEREGNQRFVAVDLAST
jgi:serine protease Do